MRALDSSEPRYELLLTWDEIDHLMMAARAQVWHYEQLVKADGRPDLIAEHDQFDAFAWEVIHKLGDARRAGAIKTFDA